MKDKLYFYFDEPKVNDSAKNVVPDSVYAAARDFCDWCEERPDGFGGEDIEGEVDRFFEGSFLDRASGLTEDEEDKMFWVFSEEGSKNWSYLVCVFYGEILVATVRVKAKFDERYVLTDIDDLMGRGGRTRNFKHSY